ncbi:hypothetical protein [Streptomyces bathyalis]|uniref:hypothetical protein n=1 Tax=Streptomyces bathyalis TaxID=2710756 RepID=UPI0018D05998|nr:hypothetical protein [Streptomyces bathyalis]
MHEALAPRTAPIPLRRRAHDGRPLPWLAGVAAAFVLAQLLLVVPGSGMGWDESVYTSQVSGHAPAAFFSAPRARGISFLAAPVAALTSSITALRVYLALLSGAGLFASLWVWRGMLPARVLATAGALFASLWITLYYGPSVMPNLWTAFGALAATGCFVRLARNREDRRARTGLVVSVAVVALMRPPDGFWLVLALGAVAVCVRRWRRPGLLALLAAGFALGSAEWIVEAYVRYGGLFERLHRAGEIQGGMGWHMAADDQIRSLAGRTLCRPCDIPWQHPATALWWFALPLLALAGTLVTPWGRRRATAVVPAVTAVVVAVPYLFLIDYAAPRFLLPSYALLALPVARLLWWVAADRHGRLRMGATSLVALGLAGHLAVQYAVLANNTAEVRTSHRDFTSAAARLQQLGVRPPCVISGDHSVQLSFYTGCTSRQTGGPDASITGAGVLAASRTSAVTVVVPPGGRPHPVAQEWRRESLAPSSSASRFHGYEVYLPATVRPTAQGGSGR